MPNDAHGTITHASGGDKADPDTVRMTQLITGMFASQAVRAFAELAIADELAKGPATAAEISAAIDTDAEATARLMRAGIALELVTVNDAGQYAANPNLNGIVFDRPNVVSAAAAAAQKLGLEQRLSAVAGDFFEAVPEADLYLMKWIMHDWEDGDCIRILANCRKAMRPGGRVVVVELQLGEGNDPGMPSLMDLNMMVVLNGRERTAHEYGELFAAAGLRLTQATRLQAPLGPWSLIEGEAA